MTKPGLYKHHKGGMYRVLLTGRVSTNGSGEGRLAVVYVGLKHGTVFVRDEAEFHQKVPAPPEAGFAPGVEIPRFTFTGEPTMSDADAEALYDGLHETFTGRKT